MSDDPVLAAIAKLTKDMANGFEQLTDTITLATGPNVRVSTMIELIRTDVRALNELVSTMQRVQLKHSARLDAIERRLP